MLQKHPFSSAKSGIDNPGKLTQPWKKKSMNIKYMETSRMSVKFTLQEKGMVTEIGLKEFLSYPLGPHFFPELLLKK